MSVNVIPTYIIAAVFEFLRHSAHDRCLNCSGFPVPKKSIDSGKYFIHDVS